MLLGFVATFAVWLVADRIGLSAIITVVVFAMTLARRLAARMTARYRIASYAVWEVAVLVLNVLAFVLIGLQLRAILARVHAGEGRMYALSALAVCAAVILVRCAWIMLHTAVDRWLQPGDARPSYGAGLLASWCGMRGSVTLAAALALPGAFPYRDVIVFCAFSVVLATLVLQGLTLRPLMRWLRLRDDGAVQREIQLARAETARAALRVLERQDTPQARTLVRQSGVAADAPRGAEA